MKIQTQSSKPKLSKTVKDILLSLKADEIMIVKNMFQEDLLEKQAKEILDPNSDFRAFHNFVLQNYVKTAERIDNKVVIVSRPPKLTEIVQDKDSDAIIKL